MSDPGHPGAVHEYDGIIEHDNRLPNWWLMTLFGAVVFSVGYWFYYHTFEVGPSVRASYDAEWSTLEQARLAKEAANPLTDDELLAASKDAAIVERGHNTFKSNCSACHGQNAEGLVGPNLTDKFWLHGGKPTEIFQTVSGGFIAKGMPSWKATLGDTQTREVVAFVLTLRNTNVAGPRPPEGVEAGP